MGAQVARAGLLSQEPKFAAVIRGYNSLTFFLNALHFLDPILPKTPKIVISVDSPTAGTSVHARATNGSGQSQRTFFESGWKSEFRKCGEERRLWKEFRRDQARDIMRARVRQ